MTQNTAPPVLLEGVSRDFGDVRALADVDLEVSEGGTVGLLGPNGSGKTTLLSLVSGLRTPTAGAVRLFGRDPRDPEARVRLGVTPQQSGLVHHLSVRGLIRFVGRHFTEADSPETLMAAFGIEHLADKRVGGLSGGQQRLLSVTLSFVGRPRLVLLDEPSTGLDINARGALWSAIRERAASGVTILLTSHYLEEVQTLSDRIVMIRSGRIVADDSTAGFIRQTATTQVHVTTDDDRALRLPGVVSARREGAVVIIDVDDAATALRALASAGIVYTDIDIRKPTLEAAFARLATGTASDMDTPRKEAS